MAVELIGFDHEVKWNEFEPKSPKVKPAEAAYIYAKFQVRYGYSYQDGGEGKHWVTWVRATATVEPESWVIQGMKDDELLRHEQGHFDIVALAMREAANLTSAITGTSADDLEAQKTAITEKFEKKMKAVSTRYDAQTDHSRKEAAQRRWLRSIRKAKKKKKKGTLSDLPD